MLRFRFVLIECVAAKSKAKKEQTKLRITWNEVKSNLLKRQQNRLPAFSREISNKKAYGKNYFVSFGLWLTINPKKNANCAKYVCVCVCYSGINYFYSLMYDDTSQVYNLYKFTTITGSSALASVCFIYVHCYFFHWGGLRLIKEKRINKFAIVLFHSWHSSFLPICQNIWKQVKFLFCCIILALRSK